MSYWAGADPRLQAVSTQLGGRLPLLCTMPAVTFPASQHQLTPSINLVIRA